MQAILRIHSEGAQPVPETLLSHNLEMTADTPQGLLTDRLANPTFRGPAHPDMFMPAGWEHGPGHNMPGMSFALVPGAGLNGTEAQMLHNFNGGWDRGLVQIGRKVRAGETLEVSLWARFQFEPVRVKVGVRPLKSSLPHYDSAEIEISTSYYQEYRASLTMPADDDEAVFFLYLQTPGQLYLDQAHLRPAGAGVFREDLFTAFSTLQIPALRFPGGCISTGYHWRHGVLPQPLRPVLFDPVFKWDVHYEFGTEEYLALCHAQGIAQHITVNIGSGTPEDAGAWAAWCAEWFRARGAEPPCAYWQLGNEHNSSHEVGTMTGKQYVDALRAFVPAIRAGYPNARIIALGEETGYGLRPGETFPWREAVLTEAAELVDLLAIHLYGFTEHTSDAEQHYLAALQVAERLAGVAQKAVADCRPYGKRVAVTEWNFWTSASHHDGKGFLEPYDIEHALYVATMLHHYLRLAPEMELTNFYNLLNPMGIFISRGPEFQETLLADIYRLYRPALPADRLPVEVESPALPNGLPALDAVCLRQGETRWLFVLNRSLTESCEVALDGAGKVEEIVILSGGHPYEEQFSTVTQPGSDEVRVPPLSVARVRLMG